MKSSAAAIVLAASASHAGAQDAAASAVTSLFAKHNEICAEALGNPSNFVASLSAKFPPNTFGIRKSPDGQLFRATIASGQGRFNTQYSRYLHNVRGYENCATYYQATVEPLFDAQSIASAFENHARTKLGDAAVKGGKLPQLYGQYGTGLDALGEDPESYEYLLEGVIPGDDLLTVSNVAPSYMSLVTMRELSAEKEAGQ